MQIPKDLPQFEADSTLILVAGSQSADMYVAHNGSIEETDKIRVETPTYSDREGHFERRSSGKTLGSGSVLENESVDVKVKNEFHNQLEEKLKNIRKEHDVEATILLSPPQDKPSTKEHLPSYIRDTIIGEINGNHIKAHPTEILEKIQKELG